mgnify:CR=1 FL=1
MKHFIILVALLTAMGLATEPTFAQDIQQDTSDIIWQKFIWPIGCGDGKFSPDGKIIYAGVGEYSGSLSNKIIMLSAETGDSIGEFSGLHCGLGNDFELEISSLGNYIITKGYGSGYLWDCNQKTLIKNLSDTFGGIFSICISPNEEYILIGKADKNIIVYSPKEEREITKFHCGGSVLDLKFSHDGTKFAVCSYYYDNHTEQYRITLTLWETGTWKKLKDLFDREGDQLRVYDISFSYDDTKIAADFGIFNLLTGEYVYPDDGTWRPKYIAFFTDSDYAFCNYIWDDGDSYSFDLYKIPEKISIRKYKIRDGGIDCDVKTNRVFVNGWDWITMLKPTITSVPEEKIKEINLRIMEENNQLYVEITSLKSGLGTIEIYNLTGQKLYELDSVYLEEGKLRKKIEIQLPSGVYFCKLRKEGIEITEKFKIER